MKRAANRGRSDGDALYYAIRFSGAAHGRIGWARLIAFLPVLKTSIRR
jgi:hypothetical protein